MTNKKLMTLLCVLTVFISPSGAGKLFNAYADNAGAYAHNDEAFLKDNELLSALNIFTVDTDDAEKGISRAEFSSLITSAMGLSGDEEAENSGGSAQKFTGNVYEYDDESWRYTGALEDGAYDGANEENAGFFKDVTLDREYYSSIKLVAALGIMTGSDGYFYPERMITMNEAVKAAVHVLNAGFLTEEQYPVGYISEASRLGLFKDINNYDGNARLTRRNASVLLYNLLHANIYENEYSSDGSYSYRINKDTCMMNNTLGLYKISGIVTADSVTSISGSEPKEGYIVADGNEYRLNDLSDDGLLGLQVDIYYHESDVNDAVYIRADNAKNKITVINPENIDSFSKSVLIYFDENNKKKSAAVTNEITVLYNGVVITDFKQDIFDLNEGCITLTDNNSDGKTDIISINKAETLIVGSIDEDKKKINDKFDLNFALSLKDYDTYKLCDVNDTQLELKNITANNILSVYKTLKSQKSQHVKIVVSQRVKNGIISGERINKGGKEVEIDGTFYELSYRAPDYSPGVNYNCYLDRNGKIAYLTPDSGMEYGYITKAGAFGSALDPVYRIRMFASDGEFYNFDLRDTVSFNNSSVSGREVYNILSKKGGELVRYSVSDNYITEILEADVDSEMFARIYYNTDSTEAKYRQIHTTYMDYSGFFLEKPIVYTDTDTVIMNIPVLYPDEEENYYLRTFANDDKVVVNEVYSSSVNSAVGDVVLCYSDEGGGGEKYPTSGVGITVVESVKNGLDSDGNDVCNLVGYNTGKLWEVSSGDSNIKKKVSALRPGDIIVINKNGINKITGFSKVFDVNTMQMLPNVHLLYNGVDTVYTQNPQQRQNEILGYVALNRTIHGKIYKRYDDESFYDVAPFIYEDGVNTGNIDADDVYNLKIPASNIFVFDRSRGILEKGGYSDLIDEVTSGDGSNIVVHMFWGTVTEAVIYR